VYVIASVGHFDAFLLFPYMSSCDVVEPFAIATQIVTAQCCEADVPEKLCTSFLLQLMHVCRPIATPHLCKLAKVLEKMFRKLNS
jgi:hypothetical protein